MKKHQGITEAQTYVNRAIPTKKDIHANSSHTHTTLKTIIRKRDLGIPKIDYTVCGILFPISCVWFAQGKKLIFWRYETNETEEINSFSSPILNLGIFIPKSKVFTDKVSYCILVITEDQVLLYGVARDTYSLINTDFVAACPSTITCHTFSDGDIFVGCENGDVYQIIYRSIDSWAFKMMHFYNPTGSIISSFVPSILKRKKNAIKALSIGSKYLLALSRNLTIYNIEGGIYKLRDIILNKEYADVQIVEENDTGCLYLVCKDGTRDFYDTKYLFSKRSPHFENRTEIFDLKFRSTDTKFCTIKKASYGGNVVTVLSLNQDQLLNYDPSKAAENCEILIIKSNISDCVISSNLLIFLTEAKVSFYEIQPIEKYLVSCRPEDVFNIFKSYGERETIVLYFHLLNNNEDVSKMEYLCFKSEETQISSLFIYLFRIIKPIWNVSFDNIDVEKFEKIQHKLRHLQTKIRGRFRSVNEFITEFLQTCFYVSFLQEYNVKTGNETLESLLVLDSNEFRKRTLNELLTVFKINRSVEPLLKTLGTKCPLFLPIEEIHLQRGLELVNKNPSRDSLLESLQNLKNVQFSEALVDKYNKLKFYYGSVVLIRESYNFDFEYLVKLLTSSVRCAGALNYSLEDPREDFIYALLEALIAILRNDQFGESCLCCDKVSSMSLNGIIKLQHPLLDKFLSEKSMNSYDMDIYNLHWKYCMYINENIKATRSILNMVDNKALPLQTKIDLLTTALSVSVNTPLAAEVKLRLELSDVQEELLKRGITDPVITSNLLSADELFNDYAYKYPDLALKIISISGYSDKAVIHDLWSLGMKGDYNQSVIFLKKSKITGTALTLDIVGDILVSKMKSSGNLGNVLVDAGFDFCEVQQFLDKRIRTEGHPEKKKALLEDLKILTNNNEFYHKVKEYCSVTYGI